MAVEEHKAKDESLNELLQNERQAQRAVEQLKEDLAAEKSEHARDLSSRSDVIAKMRDDLSALKAQTLVEQKFLKKEARSRADRNNRLFQQTENGLEEEIFRLRKELKIERRVSKETESYLLRKIEALDRDIDQWMIKSETEIEEMDNELMTLRQQRGRDLEVLTRLDAKYTEEIRIRDARRAADARLVEERKTQQEILARVNNAATKIQAFWRGCKARRALKKKKKKKV